MLRIYRLIAGFRCPTCDALLSWRAVHKTDPVRGSFRGPLVSVACPSCDSEVRIRKGRKGAYVALSIIMLLLGGVLGAWLTSYVPMFCCASNGGANFLGFIATLAFVAVPAVVLCSRILKLEIVE